MTTTTPESLTKEALASKGIEISSTEGSKNTVILKKGFDPANILTDFKFTPGTSPETIQLAYEAIDYGCQHANAIQTVRQQGLELGYKFKDFEEATSTAELHRLLKHYYPKDLVRYYRNLVAQAKILDKLVTTSENPSGNRYDKVLNMPVCYASALLTGTEDQIAEILTAIATDKQIKWTIRLIKERIKSEPEPAPKPTLAEGVPVKVRLQTEEIDRGTIGWVSSMEGEEGARTVQVQLVGGDNLELREHHVEPLDPESFTAMINTLALISRLRTGLKAIEDKDAREENDLEVRISKLNKSRLALSTKLGLKEWAIEGLAKNLPAVNLDEAIAPIGNESDKIMGVFGIVEEGAKEAVLAKAGMLVRLSNPMELRCLPTVGALIEAIAQYLFKATKKERHGIPMSCRDYNELTHHMQWQHNEILELRTQGKSDSAIKTKLEQTIAELKQQLESQPKEPGQEVYEQLEAERRLKDKLKQENIVLSEKLEEIESVYAAPQEIESPVVLELQQQNSELKARLAEMEKAIADKQNLEEQLAALQKRLSESSASTTSLSPSKPETTQEESQPDSDTRSNELLQALYTHFDDYRSKLADFAQVIPPTDIQKGDRVLVVMDHHPAKGLYGTVVSQGETKTGSFSVEMDAEVGGSRQWSLQGWYLRLVDRLGKPGIDTIADSFAQVAATYQLPGWAANGYRSSSGILHKGWDAIATCLGEFTRQQKIQSIAQVMQTAVAENNPTAVDNLRLEHHPRVLEEAQKLLKEKEREIIYLWEVAQLMRSAVASDNPSALEILRAEHSSQLLKSAAKLLSAEERKVINDWVVAANAANG